MNNTQIGDPYVNLTRNSLVGRSQSQLGGENNEIVNLSTLPAGEGASVLESLSNIRNSILKLQTKSISSAKYQKYQPS